MDAKAQKKLKAEEQHSSSNNNNSSTSSPRTLRPKRATPQPQNLEKLNAPAPEILRQTTSASDLNNRSQNNNNVPTFAQTNQANLLQTQFQAQPNKPHHDIVRQVQKAMYYQNQIIPFFTSYLHNEEYERQKFMKQTIQLANSRSGFYAPLDSQFFNFVIPVLPPSGN